MATETQYLEIRVECPVGYQAIGLELAKHGDFYLNEAGLVRQWSLPFRSAYKLVIVRKV